MSRTAQTHDRENAPRELRTRDAGTPRSTAQRAACGVQHGTWLTGDPSVRGAKRENKTGAAHLPRLGDTATAARSGGPLGRAPLLRGAGRVPGRIVNPTKGHNYDRKSHIAKGS